MLGSSFTSKLFGYVIFSIISVMALSLPALAQRRIRTSSPPRPLPLVSVPASDKGQDGLIGSVRRVRTERAELSTKDGKSTEGPRFVLNTTVYNIQGKRIDNSNSLVNESHRGRKQEYKYDNRGNVTEMMLRDKTGEILSREVYAYEFDEVGNWRKMVTSIVVFEGGKFTYERVAATYRTIAYYFDEAMAKAQKTTSLKTTSPAVNSASGEKVGSRALALNGVGSPSNGPGKGRPVAQPTTKVNSAPTSSGRTTPAPAKADHSPSNGKPKPEAILFSDGTPSIKPVIPSANYPDEAKRAGVMGTVAVVVEIDTTGQVVSARAASGPSKLRASAVAAARKARFSPASRVDKKGKRSQVISFTFSLL